MLCRIVTEDLNREQVEAIVEEEFSGFTVLTGEGHWEGNKEKTLIMEIVGVNILEKIKRVAERIKTANNQQAVLVQVIENNDFFV